MNNAAQKATRSATTQQIVDRIVWEMEKEIIPLGDVAQLRKLQQGSSAAERGLPVFWKLAVRHLEPNGALSLDSPWIDRQEKAWAAILAIAAVLIGLHDRGVPLGRAFASADISESRVLRLLRAHNGALHDGIRGIVRQLASKGQRVNVADMANVLLSDGAHWESAVRRRIARDYYASLHKEDSNA